MSYSDYMLHLEEEMREIERQSTPCYRCSHPISVHGPTGCMVGAGKISQCRCRVTVEQIRQLCFLCGEQLGEESVSASDETNNSVRVCKQCGERP